jgi:hypothetical protein
VEDVDLNTLHVDNSPGDTNVTAAVEADEEDDKNADGGDVSDDETEDGLEGGADSANSGGPVMALSPLVTAVEIIDSQASGDAVPTDGNIFVFVSNEASGVLGDVDVEMSEVSVAGECFTLWSFQLCITTFLQFLPRRAASVRHQLKALASVKDPLARVRSIKGKYIYVQCEWTSLPCHPAPIIPTARLGLSPCTLMEVFGWLCSTF